MGCGASQSGQVIPLPSRPSSSQSRRNEMTKVYENAITHTIIHREVNQNPHVVPDSTFTKPISDQLIQRVATVLTGDEMLRFGLEILDVAFKELKAGDKLYQPSLNLLNQWMTNNSDCCTAGHMYNHLQRAVSNGVMDSNILELFKHLSVEEMNGKYVSRVSHL